MHVCDEGMTKELIRSMCVCVCVGGGEGEQQ